MARVLTRLAVVWLLLCGALIAWGLFSGGAFEKGAWLMLPVTLCGPVIVLLTLAWAFARK